MPSVACRALMSCGSSAKQEIVSYGIIVIGEGKKKGLGGARNAGGQ